MFKLKRMFLIVITVLSLIFVASCDIFSVLTKGFTVKYETYGLCFVEYEENVITLPEELPTPEAKGYEFVGWYYDEAFIVEAYGGDLIIENTTLYALWNRLTYTIEFKNTKDIKVDSLKNVSKITKLPEISHDEYEFVGWYYDEDYNNIVKIDDEIYENTTVYAKWISKEYKIEFNTRGHGSLDAYSNKVIEIPSDLPTPNDIGYKFVGWYMDYDLTTPATPGTKISSNITLFAKWQELYSVTYNTNGYGEQPAKVNNILNIPEELPILTEEGYEFGGWYYDEELTSKVKVNDVLSDNVILYAKWNEIEYTVNFNLNGAVGSIDNVLVSYSEEFVLPSCNVDYKGHVFIGWNTKADGTGNTFNTSNYVSNLTTNSEITLYAIWEKVEYQLTIQLNNGKDNLVYTLKYQDDIPNIENPTKQNFEFEGWYTYIDGVETRLNLYELTMPSNNLVIYAKYIGEVSVVYVIGSDTYQTLPGITGEEIKSITNPEIVGYTFNGWYMDSSFETPYNLTVYPDKDTIIYGKITPNNIVINFNGNGSTSGTMSSQTIVYGSETPLNINTYVKTGYKFIGWALTANSTTVKYVDGYVGDIASEGSVTLYAVWERILYTVTFVTNGHGQQPDNLKNVYQLPSTLPILVEEKFIFAGWYYDKSFTNQASVNDLLTGNTTLYAKWEQEKEPTQEPTEKIVDNIIYDDFQIHFLELGNGYSGDSTYIKAGDVDILIDAGSRDSSATTIKSYVDKYCTDGKLEYLIVTHGDQDHIAGLVGNGSNGILYKYQIGTIIDSPKTTKTTQVYNNYKSKRDSLVNNGTIHYTAEQCFNGTDGAKSTFDLGDGMSFTILYNYYYFNKTSDENNYSVCTMFTYNQFNFMFTGDLEESGESKLVSYYDGSTPAKTLPKVELFKAGHHGSKTSTNADLLKKIQPEIVCVTCCAGGSEYTNNYQNTFPTQDMINRVAKYTDRVYVTTMYDISKKTYGSLNGNIIISSNGNNVGVSATNNTKKLKDSDWFNTTIYANSSGQYCSGKGKTDFYTAATSGVTAKPQRVWPTY